MKLPARFPSGETWVNPDAQKKVVFVGGFSLASDGTTGGVAYACHSLLESPLSRLVEWRLIDSTGFRMRPPWGSLVRIFRAVLRIIEMAFYFLFERVDAVLIFAPFVPTSMCEKGLMCILGKAFRKRVILSIRLDPLVPTKNGIAIRLSRLFLRLVFRCCDVVISQSHLAAGKLSKHYGCEASRIVVISNWIDAAAYDRTILEVSPSNSINKVPKLLFLGRLDAIKGVNFLLDAIRKLIDDGKPVQAIICGSGPDRGTLEEQCERLDISGHVDFRGLVTGEKKLSALFESDVFVLPSLREGLPNAMLEAMASGLPVVATEIDGVPAVIHPGENGFLVPPQDVVGLANAIKKVISDPELARKMGQTNRAAILENHDLDHVWPRVAKALDIPT